MVRPHGRRRLSLAKPVRRPRVYFRVAPANHAIGVSQIALETAVRRRTGQRRRKALANTVETPAAYSARNETTPLRHQPSATADIDRSLRRYAERAKAFTS